MSRRVLGVGVGVLALLAMPLVARAQDQGAPAGDSAKAPAAAPKGKGEMRINSNGVIQMQGPNGQTMNIRIVNAPPKKAAKPADSTKVANDSTKKAAGDSASGK